MKRKFTLLIAALALLTMIVQPGRAWGQATATYSLTPDQTSTGSSATSYITTLTEFTYEGVTWKMNQWNPKTLQVKTNQGSAASEFRFYNSSAFAGRITQVVITFSSLTVTDATGFKFIGGSSEISSTTGGTAGTWNSTSKTITWTPGASDNFTYFAFYQNGKVASGSNYLAAEDAIVVTYETGGSTTPSISADDVQMGCNAQGTSILYTVGNYVDGTMTAATEADWITDLQDNPDPLEPGEGSIEVATTVNESAAPRSATVTLTYTYDAKATVTKNVTVTQAGNPGKPYTVAEAIAAIDAGTGVTNVFATGIVCTAPTSLISGGYLTYWISDDGTETTRLQVYKGKNINGNDFTSVNDIQEGATVVVFGTLKKYNTTYEFDQNNQLISYVAPTVTVASPTFSPTEGIYEEAQSVEISCETDGATIYYTLDGSTPSNASTEYTAAINVTSTTTIKAIAYVGEESSTVASATYTIISVADISSITEVGTSYMVRGTVVATNSRGFIMGDGTGYVYYYKNGAVSQSIGDKVTVSGTTGTYGQIIQFTNTATVEEATTSNYNSTPTATVITEVPDYTQGYHLSTYFEFEGTLTKSNSNYFIALGESQIQISYPTTAQGDALTALINKTVHVKGYFSGINSSDKFTVMLESAEAVVTPTIDVTPTLVEATSEETEGTINVTLTAIVDNDIDIEWFESDGTTAATYNHDWILAEVTTSHNIYYVIGANTGDARLAYFKVFGLDDKDNIVYSELITINQAAYEASITITPNSYNAIAAGETTSFNIDYINCGYNPEVHWFDANDIEHPLGIDWINTEFIGGYYVYQCTIAANTGEERVAKFEIRARDDNSNVYTSNRVTITQSAYVVDYATLPFEWAGGSSADFAALSGVTLSGNGSDYGSTNAPYLIKFDSDNDYIMVKTDSQPAKVNIDVKMIGGASTSTITVKASTDGETFDNGEELTISGKQNEVLNLETTRTFDADVRYVKMVFTKGSNVGVGPITITKYTTDPIINADDVDLAYDATSGEIAYTITNPVAGKNLEATTSATWISNIAVSEEKVSFTTTANDGTEDRVATFTLTYEGAADKTVTVTQAHFVIDYATIPFAYDGNGTGELPVGLTPTGLGTYSSSPKMKFDGAGDNLILKLNAAPTSLSYDIKGNGSGSDHWAGTFKVQTSADGETYDDLVVYENNLGATQSITHIDLTATVRYIKWIYTEKNTGNVALGNIHASNEYDTYGDVTIDSDALATHSVTVHSGSVVTFVGTNTNADKLVIEDGGQLIHTGDVAATLLKDYKATTWPNTKSVSGWYTIASPVDGANVSVVTTTANYDFYAYDEANYTWRNEKVPANGITTFEQGVGYLYATSADKQGSFAGTMKATNAEVEKDLSYECTLANMKGFNLMGNPFTRNLTSGDVKLGDSYLTNYFVVEGGDELVAREIATYPIKPGQGFMVQATAENQKLVFNPSTAKGRSTNNGHISIAVGNESFNDMAYINIANGNTLRKMTLNTDSPKVYVMNNNKDYAAARVENLSASMPVCFQTKNIGTYTITVKANELDVEYLHLIDNALHEDIDLLLEPSYSFIASGHDNAARFTLVFKANANIDEIEANDIFAYQNGSDIIVNGNGELQVFDATGRMVMNTQVNGIQTVNIPATGMYIFRMVGDEVKTQKIVVR